MKTKRFIVAPFIIFILLSSACIHDEWGIKGEGEVVEEYRDVPEFDAVDMDISANVKIVQGPVQEIRIEGQPNILDNMETRVRDGKLHIDYDRPVWKSKGIYIYLTMPEVTHVSLSGSGNISAGNVIEGDALAISLGGSGDIDMEVDVRELRSAISGSGTIKLGGQASWQSVQISGSGEVEAFRLESEKAEVHISGSGEAKLHVLEELDVQISGSGDVTYKGNPELSSDISGSGDVRRRN